MSRVGASVRYRRLLSVVPWIAERDGPTIEEVCARFDMTREQLLADLDVVFMVGLYPYTPDELVDVVIEDERVWVRYAEFFRRPLRLTPEQALGLVTAGSSLLAVPGADGDGPLARGLDKLAKGLGIDPEEVVDVDLGPAAAETLQALSTAVQERRAVEIDYYAYGRDERTTRVIEPHRVYADQGNWYVAAWCRRAEGERVFRVDRVQAATVLDDTIGDPPDELELGVFDPSPADPRVVLDVKPGGRWIVEQYPVESVEEIDAATVRVTLAVTATAWLERLLLLLGPDARVAGGAVEFEGVAREAADRILARYVALP